MEEVSGKNGRDLHIMTKCENIQFVKSSTRAATKLGRDFLVELHRTFLVVSRLPSFPEAYISRPTSLSSTGPLLPFLSLLLLGHNNVYYNFEA